MKPEQEVIYIQKVLDGDTAAFTPLVDAYKNMVYTIALKTMGDPTEADDVAQESFVKAYQQLSHFNGTSKFSTWLYTITYRTALYALRRNKIKTQSITDNDTETFISYTPSQLVLLSQQERKHFVKEAIDSLPKIEGLLVTLYYINESSIDEIHEITELSKTNIKVKLFRARKKLKTKLSSLLNEELKSIL